MVLKKNLKVNVSAAAGYREAEFHRSVRTWATQEWAEPDGQKEGYGAREGDWEEEIRLRQRHGLSQAGRLEVRGANGGMDRKGQCWGRSWEKKWETQL